MSLAGMSFMHWHKEPPTHFDSPKPTKKQVETTRVAAFDPGMTLASVHPQPRIEGGSGPFSVLPRPVLPALSAPQPPFREVARLPHGSVGQTLGHAIPAQTTREAPSWDLPSLRSYSRNGRRSVEGLNPG